MKKLSDLEYKPLLVCLLVTMNYISNTDSKIAIHYIKNSIVYISREQPSCWEMDCKEINKATEYNRWLLNAHPQRRTIISALYAMYKQSWLQI